MVEFSVYKVCALKLDADRKDQDLLFDSWYQSEQPRSQFEAEEKKALDSILFSEICKASKVGDLGGKHHLAKRIWLAAEIKFRNRLFPRSLWIRRYLTCGVILLQNHFGNFPPAGRKTMLAYMWDVWIQKKTSPILQKGRINVVKEQYTVQWAGVKCYGFWPIR